MRSGLKEVDEETRGDVLNWVRRYCWQASQIRYGKDQHLSEVKFIGSLAALVGGVAAILGLEAQYEIRLALVVSIVILIATYSTQESWQTLREILREHKKYEDALYEEVFQNAPSLTEYDINILVRVVIEDTEDEPVDWRAIESSNLRNWPALWEIIRTVWAS